MVKYEGSHIRKPNQALSPVYLDQERSTVTKNFSNEAKKEDKCTGINSNNSFIQFIQLFLVLGLGLGDNDSLTTLF